MIIEKSITGRKLQCVVRQKGSFQINYMTCKMGIEIFTLYGCCHIGFVIALNTNCNIFFFFSKDYLENTKVYREEN